MGQGHWDDLAKTHPNDCRKPSHFAFFGAVELKFIMIGVEALLS